MVRIWVLFFVYAQLVWAPKTLAESAHFIGQIYDLNQHSFISEQQLIDALSSQRYILIGEKHDNDAHHKIEAKLIRQLSALPGGSTVVLEMLAPAQANLLRNNVNLRGHALRNAISWNDKAWPWGAYGPVIEAALNGRATLYSGNIERETMMSIYRQGVLPESAVYNSAREIASAVRENMLDDLYVEHCEAMARDKLQPMMLIQLARDAVMAEAMISANSARRILISGAYHASRFSGVPLHLAQRDKLTAAQVILLVEANDAPDIESLNAYSDSADYLWITPPAPEKDYCAAIKKANKQ